MFVPHDLIILILLRLPVKSLIRFKSVCKLWFSLISRDSHFANSHFQLANRRILLISTQESLSIDFEASLDDDSACVSLNPDCIFPQYFQDLEIKGSCRAFVLICGSSNIYLWKPSTGAHKQIPLSPFGSNLDANYFYGFGYDDSTDDYLVVSLSQHDYSEYPTLHLEYFSLKANTWKEVEGLHFPYTFEYEPTVGSGGCLYKGAIHWMSFNNDYACKVIVAFNLKERKLSFIHLPCFNPSYCDLWVYGEFLSVYIMNYSNDTVEIWAMKEYKVNSSWIMTLALPVDFIPTKNFSLLCCTKSGDIIGIIGTDDGVGLVKYNKNGQFLEQLSYSNYEVRLQVAMYVDSLLSFPSDGDNEQD